MTNCIILWQVLQCVYFCLNPDELGALNTMCVEWGRGRKDLVDRMHSQANQQWPGFKPWLFFFFFSKVKLWNAQPSYPAMTVVQTLPQLTVFFCRGEAIDSDWGSQKHGLVRWVVITEVKTTAKNLKGWSVRRVETPKDGLVRWVETPKGGLVRRVETPKGGLVSWAETPKGGVVTKVVTEIKTKLQKPGRVVWLDEWKPQRGVWLHRSWRSRSFILESPKGGLVLWVSSQRSRI